MNNAEMTRFASAVLEQNQDAVFCIEVDHKPGESETLKYAFESLGCTVVADPHRPSVLTVTVPARR